MSSRKDTFETLFSMVEDASSFIEENEGRIRDMFGGANMVALDGSTPMKEAHKYDDKVVFVAETDDSGLGSIKLKHYEEQDKLEVHLGEESATLLIPDDCLPKEAEYSVSNGVLQLDIPREKPEEIEVEEQPDDSDEENGETDEGGE